MELELTDFDLPQAIDNALMLVRDRAARRGIALQQTVDQRLGQIRGDERKIKQVLLNLLSNALKFTPEGGRVEVRASVTDRMAEVSVTDTNRVLDPCPNPRLPSIGGATPRAAMREVPRVRRAHTQHAGLARIRRIAPDAVFLTVQQPRQDVTVMDVGRRRFYRVNELALAIDPEVALHAEVPLPPLLGLMHRGVTRAGRILRRR
jgi:hypothetical protein